MGDRSNSRRTLTDEDIRILRESLQCQSGCQFTPEEIQFVRDWLDTAKTAKSEIIKWIIKGIVMLIGLASGVVVAFKMGWFKLGGK